LAFDKNRRKRFLSETAKGGEPEGQGPGWSAAIASGKAKPYPTTHLTNKDLLSPPQSEIKET
jgi:hypothetical protein